MVAAVVAATLALTAVPVLPSGVPIPSAGSATATASSIPPPDVLERMLKKRKAKVTTYSGPRTSKTNCGYVSCSVYFTRKKTRRLNRDADLHKGLSAAGTAAVCAGVAAVSTPVGGAACAAYMGANATVILHNIKRAAERRGCFKIRYRLGPGLGITYHNVRKKNRFCYRGAR